MDDDLNNARKIILPMIRKVMPGLIAQQITGVQPMSSATGSIFNFPPTPVTVTTSRDESLKCQYIAKVSGSVDMDSIQEWVDETFGARTPGYYNPRWNKITYGKWAFKHEADLTMFVLRWS